MLSELRLRESDSLISIIVPAYNASSYIRECVESVIAQTYTNWELILVDDGSTDSTLSEMKDASACDSRIKIIHTENFGVCHARNIGLDIATGSFICFLDADDLLTHDALEVLLALLLEHRCDISIGRKTSVKTSGQEVESRFPLPLELWSGLEGLTASLKDHPATHSVWGKLFRADLIRDVRFIVGKQVHEDSFFIFECMLKEPNVVVKDSCGLKYRVTEGSVSRSGFSSKMLDIMYFAREKKARIVSLEPALNDLACNVEIKACMALLLNLCKTRDIRYAPVERECIAIIKRGRKSFIAASKGDSRWFFILSHGLYPVYKRLYLLKHRKDLGLFND